MRGEELSRRKSAMLFYAILGLYTTFILFFITWLFAYLRYDKTVEITINSSGEANLELFLFFLVIPWFTFTVIFLLRDIWSRIVWRSESG